MLSLMSLPINIASIPNDAAVPHPGTVAAAPDNNSIPAPRISPSFNRSNAKAPPIIKLTPGIFFAILFPIPLPAIFVIAFTPVFLATLVPILVIDFFANLVADLLANFVITLGLFKSLDLHILSPAPLRAFINIALPNIPASISPVFLLGLNNFPLRPPRPPRLEIPAVDPSPPPRRLSIIPNFSSSISFWLRINFC